MNGNMDLQSKARKYFQTQDHTGSKHRSCPYFSYKSLVTQFISKIGSLNNILLWCKWGRTYDQLLCTFFVSFWTLLGQFLKHFLSVFSRDTVYSIFRSNLRSDVFYILACRLHEKPFWVLCFVFGEMVFSPTFGLKPQNRGITFLVLIKYRFSMC